MSEKRCVSLEELEQELERERIERDGQIAAFENAKSALINSIIEALHIPRLVDWLAKRLE